MDLLWRWRSGELHADVELVISNHERLRGDVEAAGVPYHHLPVTPETKPQQEREILSLLRGNVDLVVLARYMQIVTPTILDEFPQAVINIHHSFLPAFIGADPYRQARERGVKIIGATAHYATEDLDEGPIIEQDVARVSHRDTRADLVRRGRRDRARRARPRRTLAHREPHPRPRQPDGRLPVVVPLRQSSPQAPGERKFGGGGLRGQSRVACGGLRLPHPHPGRARCAPLWPTHPALGFSSCGGCAPTPPPDRQHDRSYRAPVRSPRPWRERARVRGIPRGEAAGPPSKREFRRGLPEGAG